MRTQSPTQRMLHLHETEKMTENISMKLPRTHSLELRRKGLDVWTTSNCLYYATAKWLGKAKLLFEMLICFTFNPIMGIVRPIWGIDERKRVVT